MSEVQKLNDSFREAQIESLRRTLYWILYWLEDPSKPTKDEVIKVIKAELAKGMTA
jgi:hypothetical protein